MTIRFSPDRRSYILSTGLLDQDGRNIVRTIRCPDEWMKFGRPFIWKGEPGFMGLTRTYMIREEKKMKFTWFWPLRVLEGLKL